MAELKAGDPFGMDHAQVTKIDWSLALKRIIQDVRTDFIYAPHLFFICTKAGDDLVALLKADLKAGTFSPGVPITIEVPKPFRIRVTTKQTRLGPNYSRPGSILLPKDRLVYQALADEAAPIIDDKTDGNRSFSHQLAPPSSAAMFLPTRTCWSALQKRLAAHSNDKTLRYILKVDVANFFGSLNQHVLINVLHDSGYPKALHSRLEAMLTAYTGDRSSRGILQGIYPSDLFGNYYLAPIDRFLNEYGVPSARYVDDLYIFVESIDAADRLLRELIPLLRSYDLVLNEAKSIIMPKSALMSEEPDLETLFSAAVEEISEQVDDDDFDADYGFQSDWEDEDEEDDDDEKKGDLELKATVMLFDSIGKYPGNEENIERFCLPLFSKAGSDYAVKHVTSVFKQRPAMTQIYASYLAKFIGQKEVAGFLLDQVNEDALFDWQKMWTLAALLQQPKAGDEAVKEAMAILKDGDRHEALRAVAAIFVGRFGDHSRRKSLIAYYSSVTPYIQTAIYFSSRYWPSVERGNAKASWGSHGPLNSLLTVALGKK
jgi:hypothetical protein